MTRCAIYIRKSREERDKPSHRLTVQREQLPAHARSQGWAVEVYDDGHASAARGKTEDLRERSRLEADIRAGKIQAVLCIELSRLSRDDSLQDYVAWLHLCSEYRVKLATPSRVLDPAQHSDWMLLLMEGGFSSVEMKVLQARMREGRAEAFRSGKYLAGNPPIPYIYDRAVGTLVIDPDQLPTFQRLMQLAETLPARQVALQIGLPHITVRRAIADERLLMYQGLRIDPGTGEAISGQWPAVLDAAQAERVRANRRAGHHSPRRTITGLLTGANIFFCGYCGRAVRTWANGRPRKDGTKLSYYGCRHLDKRGQCPRARMIPQHVIDQKVLTNITNTLGRIDQLQQYWLEHRAGNTIADQIEVIDKELAGLKVKKQRLVAAITEGVIDFVDAKQKRIELDSAIAAADTRRRELAAQGDYTPDWDGLSFTAEDLDAMTVEELREIISLIVGNITLTSSKAFITYRFPCHASGANTAEIRLPPQGITNPKGHWKIPQK